jgi:methionine sulfoxide reductase heme-binding subunit
VTATAPPRRRRPGREAATRVAVWILCLAPAALLVQRALTGRLTANPIEFITLETGFWALALLMVTLAITPVRRLTGWNLVRYRRLVGLFAFFYATLHFLTWITVGFIAFLLMVPLAVTSTRGWIRRLGPRWQLLHRLIYPAAALAVLHFYWKKSAKNDIREPLIFAGVLAALLLIRIIVRRRGARAAGSGAA